MSGIAWEIGQSRLVGVERVDDDEVVLELSPLLLLKSLAGTAQQTRWRQDGRLRLSGVEPNALPTPGPAGTITAGELAHNAFVYRDEVPLPLDCQGEVRLKLELDNGQTLALAARAIRLERDGTEKYVCHVEG